MTSHSIHGTPDLASWLRESRAEYSSDLGRPTRIVGLIGNDFPENGKGEYFNQYMSECAFPKYTARGKELSIRAHYSSEKSTLFLVLNGIADDAALLKIFDDGKNQDFFDKVKHYDEIEANLLHFLFITCHFVVICDVWSRVDIAFLQKLAKINKLRCKNRWKIDEIFGEFEAWNGSKAHEQEGRLETPYCVFLYQNNPVKSDLGVAKRKEIYDKLEQSLEDQLVRILPKLGLTENKDALFRLHPDVEFVHLLNPENLKQDAVTYIIEYVSKEDKPLVTVPKYSSLFLFLEENFKILKNLPSLENVIDGLEILESFYLEEGKIDFHTDITSEAAFVKNLMKSQIDEAFKFYKTGRLQKHNAARTVNDHEAMFAHAALYLESVYQGDLEEGLLELRSKCEEAFEGGMRMCDALSLSGNHCSLSSHPVIGDSLIKSEKWKGHKNSVTMLSTCACGHTQTCRSDPFSVKEANFDFYMFTPEFLCCKQLQRYEFPLFRADMVRLEEDIVEDWENWKESDGMNSLELEYVKKNEEEDDSDDDFDSDIEETSKRTDVSSTKREEDADTDDDLKDEDTGDEEQLHTTKFDGKMASDRISQEDLTDRTEEEEDDLEYQSSHYDTLRTRQVDYAKKLKELKDSGHKDAFIEGVPNTLNMKKRPLFPSWILTNIGSCSLYNHSSGLKQQPNFKIFGEYLIPVVKTVDVDALKWYREMEYIRAEDYRNSKRHTHKSFMRDEIVKVKLFIGFEYECSRGHRFFVNSAGEPHVQPKKSESRAGSAGPKSEWRTESDLLDVDLPLRRQCTCRKLPLQSAQLMKVHVVTPKAPVVVTVQPKIEVPGHDGEYVTGEAPLELENSRYYILQLPLVYSGPSGDFKIDIENRNRVGLWKGRSIKMECNDTRIFDLNNNVTYVILELLYEFRFSYSKYHRYISLLLCLLGLIANTVHILVLTRPRMRHSSVHTVLVCIACSDMGTMTSYLIYMMRFEYFRSDEGYAYFWVIYLKCHVMLSIALHAITLYLVVLMAFIRLNALEIATSQWLNSKRALCSAFFIASFVLFMCVPTLLAHEIQESGGFIDMNGFHSGYSVGFSKMMMSNGCFLMKANLWLTGIFLKVIPCFLLFTFTIALINRLHKNNEKRRNLIKEERAKRRGDLTTYMLLLMVGVFLITEMPQGIMAILNALFTSQFHQMVYLNLADVLDLLSLINCYVAFLVYSFTSSKYRQTLISLLPNVKITYSGLNTRQNTIKEINIQKTERLRPGSGCQTACHTPTSEKAQFL